jgi:hypothetical protein
MGIPKTITNLIVDSIRTPIFIRNLIYSPGKVMIAFPHIPGDTSTQKDSPFILNRSTSAH